MTLRRNRSGKPLRAGDLVRVTGNVAGAEDRNTLHGDVGEVVGANPHYRHADTGEVMTSVALQDGQIVAIPSRALTHE